MPSAGRSIAVRSVIRAPPLTEVFGLSPKLWPSRLKGGDTFGGCPGSVDLAAVHRSLRGLGRCYGEAWAAAALRSVTGTPPTGRPGDSRAEPADTEQRNCDAHVSISSVMEGFEPYR